jgi:hypothetical protein
MCQLVNVSISQLANVSMRQLVNVSMCQLLDEAISISRINGVLTMLNFKIFKKICENS